MATGGLYHLQSFIINKSPSAATIHSPSSKLVYKNGPCWAATADLDPALFYELQLARGRQRKGQMCYNERADNYLPL